MSQQAVPLDLVFQVLADPTRRSLLERLSRGVDRTYPASPVRVFSEGWFGGVVVGDVRRAAAPGRRGRRLPAACRVMQARPADLRQLAAPGR